MAAVLALLNDTLRSLEEKEVTPSLFAEALVQQVGERKWQRSTLRTMLSRLRALMRRDARCTEALVRAVRLDPPAAKPAEEDQHAWMQVLRRVTKYRSLAALRSMVRFYLRAGLQTRDLPLSAEDLRALCGNNRRKFLWLQLFFTHIRHGPPLPAFRPQRVQEKDEDDGEDHHRIPRAELERLHTVAARDVLDELFFTLLLTTGLRIGGLVNIRTADVADVREGRWEVRERGRTLEKGASYVHFDLHHRVRELAAVWLNQHRTGEQYLFPGRQGGHLSTRSFRERFGRMCHLAGLKGPHLHLHALRHSYAHIMLEVGNSVEVVSKLLGHADVDTTQKYYLREQAADVAKRANIPWIAPCSSPSPVPAFLRAGSSLADELDELLTHSG